MTIPENLDFSGLTPAENYAAPAELSRHIQAQLLKENGGWRVAVISSAEATERTNFMVHLAIEAASTLDAAKYIPLKQTSTAQQVLNSLSEFLNRYEKQLKSKQISNFAKSKDEETQLEQKIAPLIKLLNLRQLLIMVDHFEAAVDPTVSELLQRLVQETDSPSRFMIASNTRLTFMEQLAEQVGQLDVGAASSQSNIKNEVDTMAEKKTKPENQSTETPETPVEETDVIEVAAEKTTETAAETSPPEAVPDPQAEETPDEETPPEVVEEAEPEAEAADSTDLGLDGKSADELLALGQQLMVDSEPESAKAAYEAALTKFDTAKNQAGISTCREALGTIYLLNADYDQAMSCYEAALTSKQESADEDGTVELLHQLTLLSQLQGNMPQARAYTQQAQELRGMVAVA